MENNFKERIEKQKQKAKKIFESNPRIYCPYFEDYVNLTSDGLHHLKYSARRERKKQEQLLKFTLLPLAIKIIKKSGTLQEYRTGFVSVGKRSLKDGLYKTKKVEYFAFVAIPELDGFRQREIKIRIILRKIGDGNIIFWSVMPFGDIKNSKLYSIGIEND